MSPEVSEQAFEEAIECALLRDGFDAYPDDATAVRESPPEYDDEPVAGGYHKRQPEDYDRGLCLIPTDVVDFLLATQPKEWDKLKQHHGADVKVRFLGRLSREIGRRGHSTCCATASRTQAVGSGSHTSGPRAGSTNSCSAFTQPTSLPWCASFASASRARRASTWCSF